MVRDRMQSFGNCPEMRRWTFSVTRAPAHNRFNSGTISMAAYALAPNSYHQTITMEPRTRQQRPCQTDPGKTCCNRMATPERRNERSTDQAMATPVLMFFV